MGVADTEPVLTAEAQRRGVPVDLMSADWGKRRSTRRAEIVWAFVENNRHCEIVEYCAPRKIHVLFRELLASTYKDAVPVNRDLAGAERHLRDVELPDGLWPANHVAKGLADSALGKTASDSGGVVGELQGFWRPRTV